MKKLLILCLGLFTFAGMAQEAAPELKARLKSLSSFDAVFSQTVTDGNGEQLQNATGRIRLKQPNQLHWQVDAPNETLLIADGNAVWHVDPFVEQVIAIDQQQAIDNNPLILLAEPDSKHWQDFKVAKKGEQYTITSTQDDSQIVSLTLHFKGQTLVGLDMLDRQSQNSKLLFKEIKQNQPLSADLFRFSLPQGYELDDQRSIQAEGLNQP
ncbi:outer membrane lipoprotein chaperone LolA [Aliiglaciecola sp. CAU 1673]|uniref:outer membrane lipoprotein chaperone LolA n=1 Tax=Aliiglaciecola sp. CAU 1673 TaxID=3032595 RepID=UPI0023DC426F|nr:outer membrane lipoprotein chaperone LolA [Aliiglaciecola sp. CAU 1673]MDF2177614.1 outer membrane lipoprotein chaperone LolA [Aliiglaciecola sp. CAU 1673]